MRERLAATLGYVFWSDLAAHARRDALIVVSPDLDMLEAAEAVASNDAARVQRWIVEQRLSKPTAEELARWPAEPSARFESVVVQPFVLVRPELPRTRPPSN